MKKIIVAFFFTSLNLLTNQSILFAKTVESEDMNTYFGIWIVLVVLIVLLLAFLIKVVFRLDDFLSHKGKEIKKVDPKALDEIIFNYDKEDLDYLLLKRNSGSDKSKN